MHTTDTGNRQTDSIDTDRQVMHTTDTGNRQTDSIDTDNRHAHNRHRQTA